MISREVAREIVRLVFFIIDYVTRIALGAAILVGPVDAAKREFQPRALRGGGCLGCRAAAREAPRRAVFVFSFTLATCGVPC